MSTLSPDPSVDVPHYPMPRECPFDPPAKIGELRRHQPVAKVRIWDGSEAWLITRYDDVRAVLADPRFSSDPSKEGYPVTSAGMKKHHGDSPTFIAMDDPDHAHYRRMLTGEFTVRRIEAMRPTIERVTRELLDAIEQMPQPVDLVSEFALPLASTVICELLGVPYEDHDFFQDHSMALLNVKGDPDVAARAAEELSAYLGKLVADKMAAPADDLLSRVIEKRVRTGELTEKQLTALAILLLVAGHETTANQIALGTLYLIENPEHAAAVRDGDAATVAAACEELLRLLTVTHIGRRRVALEDVEIAGVTIRAGDGVIAAGESANRDECQFPDPDELQLERTDNHHVAFGYGIHQCLGQPIARIELQTTYPAILRRLPDLRVAVPVEELRFRGDMVVYGLHELPVRWS